MKASALYSSRYYWISGVVLAVAGVVLARVIAAGLEEQGRRLATLAGQLIALTGLVVICFGVRKRLSSGHTAGESEP